MVDNIIFLDLETTGLNFKRDRIVEIGLVPLKKNGKRGKRFLVNPGIPIKKRAYMVHGISLDDVKGSPYFEDIKDEVLKTLEGNIIVGFNLLNFDMPFLNYELFRIGEKPIFNRVVDLKEVAKALFKEPPNSLYSLAKHLEIKVNKIHRALEDAETTRKIFVKLMELNGKIFQDIGTLESITFSSYPNKSLQILNLAREYRLLRIKYFTKFFGIREFEAEPFIILKNIIIVKDFLGNPKKLYIPRIIQISPLK